jgi:O-methyltransferase involved in polyketide biosynthesis
MSDSAIDGLKGVSESLLLPLYIRAKEMNQPNPILKDERAVELVQKLKYDESMFNPAQVREDVQVSILLRNRQFDLITSAYLARYPNAIVVHLGCGLDTRFERLDNSQLEWYDLDLPKVTALRHELLDVETERYHLLACSVIDPAWIDMVSIHLPRPFLFLAEGLFMFFEEDQIKSLVLALNGRFPGSELVFDAFSPFYAWGNNRRVNRTHIGAAALWSLKDSKELENWAEGIHLLDEWYPFLCPEPRLAHLRWVRFIPVLAKTTGIFRYRLSDRVV